MEDRKSKIEYIAVMALYGTTGIITKFIPFSPNFIAFTRALIALLFIALIMLIGRKRLDVASAKKNAVCLIAVGILLAANWIAFFEACIYTTVAKASLCYYMAPIIVIILSPILYKEKLGIKKIICVIAAVIGMFLVSGVLSDTRSGDEKGIIIGLLAAILYAMVIIISKKIKQMESLDKTVIQLAIATVVLLPIVFLAKESAVTDATALQWVLLTVIGVFNTGVAYLIYFDSVTKLSAQTVAIFAYADPIVSVLLSAIALKEPLGISGIVGAILVIGAMIINEL